MNFELCQKIHIIYLFLYRYYFFVNLLYLQWLFIYRKFGSKTIYFFKHRSIYEIQDWFLIILFLKLDHNIENYLANCLVLVLWVSLLFLIVQYLRETIFLKYQSFLKSKLYSWPCPLVLNLKGIVFDHIFFVVIFFNIDISNL